MAGEAPPDEWQVSIDTTRVGALGREAFVREYGAARDREDAVHRGLGLVMAGLALLHSNGAHRGTVSAWVQRYFDNLYGRMN